MDLYYKLTDLDTQEYYLVIVVCLVAIFLQRELMGSDVFTVVSIPTFFLASLLSIYTFKIRQFFYFGDHTVQVVTASVCGITLAFLTFLLVVSAKSAITGRAITRRLKDRKLDSGAKTEQPNVS